MTTPRAEAAGLRVARPAFAGQLLLLVVLRPPKGDLADCSQLPRWMEVGFGKTFHVGAQVGQVGWVMAEGSRSQDWQQRDAIVSSVIGGGIDLFITQGRD